MIIKNYSTLNDDMFLCVPWDDACHRLSAKGYKIIISDVVFGNDAHTLMQIHIAIISRGRVVTMPELFKSHTTAKHEQLLAEFENNLRQCISRNVVFKEGCLDSSIVKVWYYHPQTPSLRNDNSSSELYCRIAITAANICAPDTNAENRILSELREYLTGFINQT